MTARRTTPLPTFLERRSSDEYAPPTRSASEARALDRFAAGAGEHARRAGVSLGAWSASRRGTAAGLLALNAEAGHEFYRVPGAAAEDETTANEALGGSDVVIDVQTHFVAERPECRPWYASIRGLYEAVRPGWWRGMDDLAAYDFEQYLRCVFVESETALAVLTSAPGLGPERMLHDRELAGTRELIDRLGGGGRLLNHSVVHPDVPGEIELLAEKCERLRPVGWKVYTLAQPGWYLDDEATGLPFL